MPSISITEGYTFTNWGPLTTTFTAPTSCATATGNYMIGLNTTAPVWEYAIQCSTSGYGDCIPSGTLSYLTSSNDNPKTIDNQAYLSPGLYCPSGWGYKGNCSTQCRQHLTITEALEPSFSYSEKVISKFIARASITRLPSWKMSTASIWFILSTSLKSSQKSKFILQRCRSINLLCSNIIDFESGQGSLDLAASEISSVTSPG